MKIGGWRTCCILKIMDRSNCDFGHNPKKNEDSRILYCGLIAPTTSALQTSAQIGIWLNECVACIATVDHPVEREYPLSSASRWPVSCARLVRV